MILLVLACIGSGIQLSVPVIKTKRKYFNQVLNNMTKLTMPLEGNQATHLNLHNNQALILRKGVWYHTYQQVWQVALIQSAKWELLDKGKIVPINGACYNPSRLKLNANNTNKSLTH